MNTLKYFGSRLLSLSSIFSDYLEPQCKEKVHISSMLWRYLPSKSKVANAPKKNHKC